MKKIIIIPIIGIIAIIIASFLINPSEKNNDSTFHVTLADPEIYTNGIYSESIRIEKGEYSFRFVPNGSSPDTLTIMVVGEKINFIENFKLKGTLHEAGISEYYTWDYTGEKIIEISEMQQVEITINPNGDTLGSVSVSIIEN